MRPKICVPIVASLRDAITRQAREIEESRADMAEWRIDFYAGYEKELLSIVQELKTILKTKELIVTLRTTAEGGEANGSRFSYFSWIEGVLEQGIADYVDVEVERDLKTLTELTKKYAFSPVKVIGSYHNFDKTPEEEEIVTRLKQAKQCGCQISKLACMPEKKEDVETLLRATHIMKREEPEQSIITMSMGELGKVSRLYGGLYGSEISFGTIQEASAPGQVSLEKMLEVYDKIYVEKKHIILIGFMGVGKSTVSKELSRLSKYPEVDTDQWIVEKENRSIADIFAKEGEEYFRDLETSMIDELGTWEPSIISCGGGMALRELNVRKLQQLGEIVLLTAKPETIYERVKGNEERPLLKGNMNVEYIQSLMEKRRPYYEKAATQTVATDGREAEEIAKEILEKCL